MNVYNTLIIRIVVASKHLNNTYMYVYFNIY